MNVSRSSLPDSDKRAAQTARRPRFRTPRSAFRIHRPFVLINMSMTADGKIATTNRAVSSFGSKRDHEHLLELRATADAVMCGARTADLNEVTLDPGGRKFRQLRLRRGLAEFNVRIIVTGSGTLNPRARIFSSRSAPVPGAAALEDRSDVSDEMEACINSPSQRLGTGALRSPVIILTTTRASKTRLNRLRTAADEVKAFGQKELNLRAALRWLYEKWNVRRLVCEGGGALNDAMFRAGLVDELHLTLCPRIIGGRGAPTIADGVGFQKLARAAQLRLVSAKRVGDELFLIYRSCTSRR